MPYQPEATKDKILAAAGEIFAQKGFKDATIRTMARKAGVNIAAINYHFRDKEGLYRAVLAEVFQSGFSRFPADMGLPPNAEPAERLRVFIKAMFLRLQSDDGWGGLAGNGRLIARELLDPSPAFDAVLERHIKPHKDLLVSIIIAIMGTNPGPRLLMPCAISIIGQCIYFALAARVIERISAEEAPTSANLHHLADSVWRFSLGGIESIKNAPFPATKECL